MSVEEVRGCEGTEADPEDPGQAQRGQVAPGLTSTQEEVRPQPEEGGDHHQGCPSPRTLPAGSPGPRLVEVSESE
jgi:hypothetical protein